MTFKTPHVSRTNKCSRPVCTVTYAALRQRQPINMRGDRLPQIRSLCGRHRPPKPHLQATPLPGHPRGWHLALRPTGVPLAGTPPAQSPPLQSTRTSYSPWMSSMRLCRWTCEIFAADGSETVCQMTLAC